MERPESAGSYLVCVDAWERQTGWVEDNSIREVAVGRPDTLTRAKTRGHRRGMRWSCLTHSWRRWSSFRLVRPIMRRFLSLAARGPNSFSKGNLTMVSPLTRGCCAFRGRDASAVAERNVECSRGRLSLRSLHASWEPPRCCIKWRVVQRTGGLAHEVFLPDFVPIFPNEFSTSLTWTFNCAMIRHAECVPLLKCT